MHDLWQTCVAAFSFFFVGFLLAILLGCRIQQWSRLEALCKNYKWAELLWGKCHLKSCHSEPKLTEDFLRQSNESERKEIMKTILMPRGVTKKFHEDVYKYIDHIVDENFDLLEKGFRGEHLITCHYVPDESGIGFKCIWEHHYRVYRVKEKIMPIKTYEDRNATHPEFFLTPDSGKKSTLISPKISHEEGDGEKWTVREYDIPEEMQESSYVEVRRIVEETFNEPWGCTCFLFAVPTKNIELKIYHSDDFEIKTKDFFIEGSTPRLVAPTRKDNLKMHFSCRQWFAPGTGFSILVHRIR